MTNIFPEILAPNFFHIDKLPDYGLKLFENELGREIRRYTEDTGYKTELKIQYNGLRSAEVKALTAFYLQVKGTFDKFTLPINFYRSPSSITNSLTALSDTTEWRFMNPPMIQTVISDIYTVEIRLLSLKDSLNPDSSKIIGFVDSVNVDFILPSILIQQKQVTELVPIALEFIISSIDLSQSVTVNSIDLTLETSELTFTTSTSVDSRSIQSLSLSFVASQTGFGILNINSFEQMPSIIVSGTFTSLARYIHLVNTASGVASTTLPSDALDDTTIIYSDYAGTSTSSPTGFGLNAFTLNAPVGQTIQGQSSRVLNVENTSIQVIKKGNRWTIVGTELATGNPSGGGDGGGTNGIIPLELMQGTLNVQLSYVSNADQNDLFYYLGTNEGATAWSNPTTNGRVIATSSTGVGTGDVNSLTNRNYNNNENQQWTSTPTRTIVYDLGRPAFSSDSINILCQRNEGNQTLTLAYSNDNTNWTTVTTGQTVGGNYLNSWTRVTYPKTVHARYWRVTLISSNVGFASWAEVMLYGEWIPTSLTILFLNPSWKGKLAYNLLYSNNFNLTIPDTTTDFPVGWFCYVRNDTQNGTITITPQNSNVVLASPNGLTLTKDDLYLLIHNGSKSWFIQKLTNTINTVGTGLTLNSSKGLSNSFTSDSIDRLIETPVNKTYTLVSVAKFGFTIENISISTTSGTCTAALQINGVNVGGLNNISVTSTNQNISSTSAKTVVVSGRVTLVITSNSSASDLIFSIGILRT